MRIIAGTHRGRPILPPRDAATTRPITDRVKKSLFDRLWSLGYLDAGGRVLDIFCGTGSMGLEALSRGADHCVFVDQDRDALHRLEQNLQTLQFSDRAQVLRISALRAGWVDHLPRGQVHIAFVDPPYALLRDSDSAARFAPLFEALARAAEPGGAMVVRTDKRTPAPDAPGWPAPQSHTYGSMTLHFYLQPAPTETQSSALPPAA